MGFSGQLSSVNLTDIFQTLHMNRQTGTLSVLPGPGAGASAHEVHVFFDQGQIAAVTAPPVENRPMIVNTMVRKGMIQQDQLDELMRRLRSTGQNVRDLLMATGWLPENQLNDIASWCIEEITCPIFEWPEGEFTFTDGDPVPQLQVQDIVEVGRPFLQTTSLVMEATRRKDEWLRIRQVLPDEGALLIIDNDGRANLRNLQTDAEMQKVMRLMDGRRTIDAIAAQSGTNRFDTYAIAAQLIVAQVARARSPAEIVEDAQQLRAAGESGKALELLENALRHAQAPEIQRPLAEVCAEQQQVPRAVELYLTLIQQAQDQGDLEGALKDLDTVLTLSPEDPDLHFDRAQVHAELGNVEPAASGYVKAAEAYLQTKDIAKAIDSCHRAKNLLPRSPEPHRWLAKAYLLDGNTENATVEYKALWHALLTGHRPKAALEELMTILQQDCKYQAVKDQVLAHAQNSEAVKNSRAFRSVMQVLLALLIVVFGWVAWRAYEDTILRRQAFEAVNQVEAALHDRFQKLDHPRLRNDFADLKSRYGVKFPEIDQTLDRLAATTEADFESRAGDRLKQADALFQGGKYGQAYAALDELVKGFPNTKAAREAVHAKERFHTEEIRNEVDAREVEARRRWDQLQWDEALAMLRPILARGDLPNDRRAVFTGLEVEWSSSLKSARTLAERAAKIEARRDFPAALTAWRRATSGEGESDAARARDRLSALERVVAEDLLTRARDAAGRGEDQAAFVLIDEALALAKIAVGPGPKQALSAVQLPIVVSVDNRNARLVISRSGGGAATTGDGQQVKAPAGTTGSWKHQVDWQLDETVQITCLRAGFSPQTVQIALANRRCRTTFNLVRGPRHRIELTGIPVTAPVISGKTVLIGTNKATIEVLDPAAGAARPIPFPEGVAEFNGPPQLFAGRAYAVLDERLQTVDLAARVRLWGWPEGQSNIRLNASFLIQDHDLIQGRLLLVLGTDRGVILADTDGNGQVVPYPPLPRTLEASGQPFGDHPDISTSLVYLPAGNQIAVLDVTAASRSTPATILHVIKLRGEAIGRLVPATVAGQRALLVADASGLISAISTDPKAPEGKRLIGSWPVDGTQPTTPVVAGGVAYVAVPEGRVHCLDLTQVGAAKWRAPAKPAAGAPPTTLGPLIGMPAVGLRSVYIADANGILRSLDPATGSERWKADLGAPAIGGICAIDGRLVIPTRAGHAVVFEEGEE